MPQPLSAISVGVRYALGYGCKCFLELDNLFSFFFFPLARDNNSLLSFLLSIQGIPYILLGSYTFWFLLYKTKLYYTRVGQYKIYNNTTKYNDNTNRSNNIKSEA